MNDKFKRLFEVLLVASGFSAIWAIGILVYGEWTTADTAHFGSLLGEKYEGLFAFTPAAVVSLGFILTNIAAKRGSKHIFAATEIMLLLPFAAWVIGVSLLALSNIAFDGTVILGIPAALFILVASPAITWINFICEISYPFGLIASLAAYLILAFSFIAIYKIKSRKVS